MSKKSIDWETISILSELRSRYSIFDEEERKYYHALSEAIKALKAEGDEE